MAYFDMYFDPLNWLRQNLILIIITMIIIITIIVITPSRINKEFLSSINN